MIPKELCHYTKKDVALEKILFGKKIKLGLIGLTNDPKEGNQNKPVIMFSNISHQREFNPWEFSDETEKISKDEWKVLCLTKHLQGRTTNNTLKNVVSSRFRHGYSRPRMWAQYAENHTGLCIIFYGNKLNANINSALKDREQCQIFHGEVTYRNYNSVESKWLDYSDIIKYGLTNGIRKHYSDNYQHYFLSKFPDWQGESEYRWLIHSPTKEPELISIEGTMKAVLVGSEFPKVYEPAIKKICKELNVSAGRMHWNNGMPDPNFLEIYDPKN